MNPPNKRQAPPPPNEGAADGTAVSFALEALRKMADQNQNSSIRPVLVTVRSAGAGSKESFLTMLDGGAGAVSAELARSWMDVTGTPMPSDAIVFVDSVTFGQMPDISSFGPTSFFDGLERAALSGRFPARLALSAGKHTLDPIPDDVIVAEVTTSCAFVLAPGRARVHPSVMVRADAWRRRFAAALLSAEAGGWRDMDSWALDELLAWVSSAARGTLTVAAVRWATSTAWARIDGDGTMSTADWLRSLTPPPPTDTAAKTEAEFAFLRPHQHAELAFAIAVERATTPLPPWDAVCGYQGRASHPPHLQHSRAEQTRGGLIVSSPGAGKTATVVALSLANPVAGGTLVLCPPMCVAGWLRDVRAFSAAAGSPEAAENVVVVGAPDAFYRSLPALRAARYGRVVFDDFHCYAGSATFSARANEIDADLRWALSATPSPRTMAPFLLGALLRARPLLCKQEQAAVQRSADAPFERSYEPVLPAYLAAVTACHDVGPVPASNTVLRVPLSPREAEAYEALSHRRGATPTTLRRALELGVPLATAVPSDALFERTPPVAGAPTVVGQCPLCFIESAETCVLQPCEHALCRECARRVLMEPCATCASCPPTATIFPRVTLLPSAPKSCPNCMRRATPLCPLCGVAATRADYRAATRTTKMVALFAALRKVPSHERALIVVSDAARSREVLDAASAAGVPVVHAGARTVGRETKVLIAQPNLVAGLELLNASRIFFMTRLPWAESRQVIGRVCRPGQTLPVIVTTLACAGTVEDI